MSKRLGFTLVEILIVIAIISILAAVFLPMLLNPRERAYDAATQSCLKEISTRQHAHATQSPFEFDQAFNPLMITACNGVVFLTNTVTADSFTYQAKHQNGGNTYQIAPGTGVTKIP